MKYLILMVLFLALSTFATQWQPPEPVYGLLENGYNFNSDNTIAYGSKWHDGAWWGDICYYNWDGSEWVWGGWVQGNVNAQNNYEEEPFITYDGQHLYFSRYGLMYGYTHTLCVADWDGSQFVNFRPLNSSINVGNTRFPSITQDGQKLYFSRGMIWMSEWNGTDWGEPVFLPYAVNGGNGYRMDVTISPDDQEIYFTGASPWPNRLAFSRRIGGVWQQWQYCDYNINPPDNPWIHSPAFTYSDYADQYIYFQKSIGSPYTNRSLRSPVSVEPSSIGKIKSNYAR